MEIIRSVVANNELVTPGNDIVEYPTILDVDAGNFGYEQLKFVISATGTMPLGSTLVVYVLKDNIGLIEKITMDMVNDLSNNIKVIETKLLKAHLADTIRCVLSVKRHTSDFRFTAMVQLSDFGDNVLGGTHEMFMVKREF